MFLSGNGAIAHRLGDVGLTSVPNGGKPVANCVPIGANVAIGAA
jgi:hypothetical protein